MHKNSTILGVKLQEQITRKFVRNPVQITVVTKLPFISNVQ